MKQPNFVLIMTDQQRADLRMAEGYPLDTMPFLDQIGQNGLDLEQAYTPNPTCMPARVSLFTGRYPQCHRVRTNHNRKDAYYYRDMLDVLKEEGYVTALCGKNHSHHEDSDFDYHVTNGHWGHEGGKMYTGAEEELANFLDRNRMESMIPSPGGVEAQHPYQNVTSAFRFIDEKTEGQPFFLWLSFAEPHNPYQVPEPYFSMFPPESLPPLHTLPGDADQKGNRFSWIRDRWQQMYGEDLEAHIQRDRSNYHGMLRLIDDQVRRFVDGLEERGLLEDTIVIFVSDHGDFVGEYGAMRKGPDLPEVLCRVPMVWMGRGIKRQGRRNDCCVSLLDIFPTVCDLLGREIPFGVQGRSLLPILRGEALPEKEFDTAYAESGFSGLYWGEEDQLTIEEEGAWVEGREFDCLNTWTQCGQVRMIRKGGYKLQLDMMGNGYMYHLPEDPFELCNLYEDPRYQETKTQLLAELSSCMMRAADPLPAPRYRYRVKRHPKGYWFQTYASDDPGVQDLTLKK